MILSLNSNFSDEDISNDAVYHHTPLEYFWRFESEDMIKTLTSNTNKYSFQKKRACIFYYKFFFQSFFRNLGFTGLR